MMKVSSAEFIKNYGTLTDKALVEPVTITKNGRDRLVVISSDEYERMRRRDRRVVRVEDLSDEEFEEIMQQRVPEEYDYLNEELKDWNPAT
jgi:PHD/YefM family antitoxin component YafN of YafNO toxin-antitoxin module